MKNLPLPLPETKDINSVAKLIVGSAGGLLPPRAVWSHNIECVACHLGRARCGQHRCRREWGRLLPAEAFCILAALKRGRDEAVWHGQTINEEVFSPDVRATGRAMSKKADASAPGFIFRHWHKGGACSLRSGPQPRGEYCDDDDGQATTGITSPACRRLHVDLGQRAHDVVKRNGRVDPGTHVLGHAAFEVRRVQHQCCVTGIVRRVQVDLKVDGNRLVGDRQSNEQLTPLNARGVGLPALFVFARKR